MIRTHKVEPIGTRKTAGFVDRWLPSGEHDAKNSGLQEIELPVFPPSRGDELRELRHSLKLNLTPAAKLLGWTVLELCEVESGKRAPEDWDAVFNTLKAGAR